MEYTFSKPYTFDGEEYKSIEFDLESLKGSDIAVIKRQFIRGGNFTPSPALDSEFCALILAKVTKKPIEFFNDLPSKDYLLITQEVTNFLLA